MSLYNRRKFIFLSLATTGCSFSPVYKSDVGPAFLRGKIVLPKPRVEMSICYTQSLKKILVN